jgi:hypothetical protein
MTRKSALKLSRKLFSPLDIHVRRLADRATSRNGRKVRLFYLTNLFLIRFDFQGATSRRLILRS